MIVSELRHFLDMPDDAVRADAPVSLRRFVSHRVATLSSPPRRVCPPPPWWRNPSVTTVLAAGADRAVAALQEAIDSGMLEARASGLAFANPLMRSVVVDEPPRVDCRSVH